MCVCVDGEGVNERLSKGKTIRVDKRKGDERE